MTDKDRIDFLERSALTQSVSIDRNSLIGSQPGQEEFIVHKPRFLRPTTELAQDINYIHNGKIIPGKVIPYKDIDGNWCLKSLPFTVASIG